MRNLCFNGSGEDFTEFKLCSFSVSPVIRLLKPFFMILVPKNGPFLFSIIVTETVNHGDFPPLVLCKIFPRAIKAQISQSEANVEAAKSISGKTESLRPVIADREPNPII